MMREYAPLSMPTVPRPDFREEATALFDDMVRVRRDLHRHPELGFQETRTAAIVALQPKAVAVWVAISRMRR